MNDSENKKKDFYFGELTKISFDDNDDDLDFDEALFNIHNLKASAI